MRIVEKTVKVLKRREKIIRGKTETSNPKSGMGINVCVCVCLCVQIIILSLSYYVIKFSLEQHGVFFLSPTRPLYEILDTFIKFLLPSLLVQPSKKASQKRK